MGGGLTYRPPVIPSDIPSDIGNLAGAPKELDVGEAEGLSFLTPSTTPRMSGVQPGPNPSAPAFTIGPPAMSSQGGGPVAEGLGGGAVGAGGWSKRGGDG